MAKLTLIYAYWPNQPFGVTWCDLPWALRDAGLPKRLHEAGHEVVESMLMTEQDHPEELLSGVLLAGDIAVEVRKARAEGELAVVLCGSCSVAAVGSIAGLARPDAPPPGIVWFDAHPDLNTPETTASGLFEGMALAVATGHAWRHLSAERAGLIAGSLDKTAFVGARDIEPGERALMDRHSVPICATADEVAARIDGTDETYVHLDMDVHDAVHCRTNAFPVPGGPNVTDVRAMLTGVPRISVLAVTGLDPAAADVTKACDIAIGHIEAVASASERQS